MNVQLDLEALKRLLNVIGGDPEDLAELRAEYLETAPEIMAQMTAAAISGDRDGLRVAAHSLKGNARDFGAIALSELCAELEAASKANAIADPIAAVAAIEAAEVAARAALACVDIDSLG